MSDLLWLLRWALRANGPWIRCGRRIGGHWIAECETADSIVLRMESGSTPLRALRRRTA